MEEQNTQAPEIIPHRLYTTGEVAEMLDLHPDTVYRIPERLLARTKVGPRRGRTKILGSDLLAYLRSDRKVA